MYIYPGVGREDLKNGPGHFPETPMPGQLGNSAIAGHRTTYGHPFLELDELEIGDEIIVEMPYGIFSYAVTAIDIVEPSDREVIATTDPDLATLTLATCHPAFSARQRLIVHAELDVDKSDAPGAPVINYGRDTPIPTEVGLPGEEVGDPTATSAPTTSAAATTTEGIATTTIAGQTTVAGSTAGTAPAASTTPTTSFVGPSTTADPIYSVEPGGGASGGTTDVLDNDEEAFSNRWFSDEEAFPQVTLWAGSCAAIAVAAYELAKRFRNLAIGAMIGIAPFAVGLYFFYENVNRLLPAAL
jgi:sortase A